MSMRSFPEFRRILQAAVFAALAASLLLWTQAGAASEDIAGRLDGVVSRAVAEGRIVGAVVMVSKDGQVVYDKAFGLADVETRTPLRRDTVFRLASMTKPIVCAAALALADQGRLTLDDPVTRWLPAFTPRLASGEPATITVRHLLTHTAGLSYGFLEPPDGSW